MKKTILFIKKEFLEMLPPTLFFLVAFHIAAFVKSLIFQQYGIDATSAIYATIGAMLVGKAILIADKFKWLNLYHKDRLIYRVLWKVGVYTVFVLFFQYLEELIPMLIRHESWREASIHTYEEIVWPKFWAVHIVLVLFLVIYVSASELIKRMGKEQFKALVFDKS